LKGIDVRRLRVSQGLTNQVSLLRPRGRLDGERLPPPQHSDTLLEAEQGLKQVLFHDRA